MVTRANAINLGNLPSYRIGYEAYDQDKLGLGQLMIQMNGGVPEEHYAGPFPVEVMRPMEASTAIPLCFPWAMQWSDTATSQWDWIFTADVATAAATRRLGMFRFNRLTGDATYDGFLTITFPGTSEAKTIRGLRMSYEKSTNGTVAVSGTAVTGTSTTFQTNRVCVGNRIGFGSTDPSLIGTWYEISAIGSETGITLTSSAGTIAAGTPYVIEDLRAYLAVTSVTTSLGGLYVIKGLRRELFSPGGGAVPAATTVDNIRACYFLKDATTGTATVVFGAALEEKTSLQNRNFWMLDTLANPVLHKHNVYAALTLTAGSTTSSFLFKTGSGGALVGAPSQLNNGRLATANHGPGAGLDCIYFTTATRIYRTVDTASITAASTSWLIDNMVEVPPGGVATYAATGGMSAIEFAGTLDKFVVTSSGAAGVRSYLTNYRTDSGQMDRLLFVDTKQIDQSAASINATPIPTPLALPFTIWVERGVMYVARFGTALTTNHLYVVPLGADWEYSDLTSSYIISPRLATSGARQYLQAFAQSAQVLGGSTGQSLGLPTEPYRIKYRTAGIVDNTGGWTLLGQDGLMSGGAGAEYIQFRLEFRVSNTMVPGRILNLGVLYEDNSTDSHYQLSATKSDATDKRFAWRHAVSFGAAVPTLYVRLYDAVNGGLLLTDNSVSSTLGVFQRSTDGTSWSAFSTADKSNDTTYVRYTPTSLADNINVRPVLSLS